NRKGPQAARRQRRSVAGSRGAGRRSAERRHAGRLPYRRAGLCALAERPRRIRAVGYIGMRFLAGQRGAGRLPRDRRRRRQSGFGRPLPDVGQRTAGCLGGFPRAVDSLDCRPARPLSRRGSSMTNTILTLHDPAATARHYAEGLWRQDTLYTLLAQHADRRSQAFALRDGARRLSWAELLAIVNAVAADLDAAGLKRGERVAVWLPSSVEAVAVQLACSRQGYVCNPSLHRNYTVAEIVE